MFKQNVFLTIVLMSLIECHVGAVGMQQMPGMPNAAMYGYQGQPGINAYGNPMYQQAPLYAQAQMYPQQPATHLAAQAPGQTGGAPASTGGYAVAQPNPNAPNHSALSAQQIAAATNQHSPDPFLDANGNPLDPIAAAVLTKSEANDANQIDLSGNDNDDSTDSAADTSAPTASGQATTQDSNA